MIEMHKPGLHPATWHVLVDDVGMAQLEAEAGALPDPYVGDVYSQVMGINIYRGICPCDSEAYKLHRVLKAQHEQWLNCTCRCHGTPMRVDHVGEDCCARPGVRR